MEIHYTVKVYYSRPLFVSNFFYPCITNGWKWRTGLLSQIEGDNLVNFGKNSLKHFSKTQILFSGINHCHFAFPRKFLASLYIFISLYFRPSCIFGFFGNQIFGKGSRNNLLGTSKIYTADPERFNLL